MITSRNLLRVSYVRDVLTPTSHLLFRCLAAPAQGDQLRIVQVLLDVVY
jgi:hypothetical protein